MTLLSFLAGLLLLIAGAEALVRGSSRLAARFGIPPLVIGLTVVAFGTSSPELAVSIHASFTGQAALAVGNVVGSNIFNVLFILGIAAVIAPLTVSQQLIRFDVPLMIALSALLLILGLDGALGRVEGIALFLGLIAYVVFLIRTSRTEPPAVQEEYNREYGKGTQNRGGSLSGDILFSLGGLAGLAAGSYLLVEGAAAIARSLGVSELVIGLTIIAAGTSLPEVVTSVVAGLRGERDIAVGNVVGSNLFNILGVLGISAALTPGGVAISEAALRFDIPVMIAVAVACLPVAFTGNLISRWEGGVFLAYYVAYTLCLVMDATGHEALPVFGVAMLYFALPLTTLTLIVMSWRAIRDRRKLRRP